MKLGIMGAMPEEIHLLKECMDQAVVRHIAQREFVEGKINNVDVVVVFSHIGKVAASISATLLIEHFQVDVIIFTGLAGAVTHDLNIGDIVISNQLVQHDMDASPIFPRYELPLLNVKEIAADRKWLAKIKDAVTIFIAQHLHDEITTAQLKSLGINQPNCVIGNIATGDQFVKSNETLNRLRNDFDAIKCVEMEGASLAQVCHAFNIPFVVVRIISDRADHAAHIDFPKFLDVASLFSKGIIWQLTSHC